jgi:hypothetical protein
VRENILDVEQSDELRVFAVWLNQRSNDPRVSQYWDGEGITGTYFAEEDVAGMGYAGFVYDVYYVFGPSASWANELPVPASAGGPVLFEGEKLLAAIRDQL